MNYRTSNMQKSNNWRAPSDGSVAHKLLSIELEHHHETQSLRREIRRLRAEVGLMARLRNFHQAQTERLADILRKLPPPDVPTRDTPKVAEPPNPQNDTTVEERGRPRTRGGSGSDKSTSREDRKQRTKEKGKDVEEDKPMTDVCDHTTGENRNDTSAALPRQLGATTSPKTSLPAYIRKPESQTGHSRSGSRTRATSVVSALRKTRSTTKSPAPTRKPEEVTSAKKVRRGGKMKTRETADSVKKEKDEKEFNRLVKLVEDEDMEYWDVETLETVTKMLNEITTKWKFVDYRVVRTG